MKEEEKNKTVAASVLAEALDVLENIQKSHSTQRILWLTENSENLTKALRIAIHELMTPKFGKWNVFSSRPIDEEEKESFPDCTSMFDCILPHNGQEVIISNRKYVYTDTFWNEGCDGCFLDGGEDIEDGMAWMPMPNVYKPEDNNDPTDGSEA